MNTVTALEDATTTLRAIRTRLKQRKTSLVGSRKSTAIESAYVIGFYEGQVAAAIEALEQVAAAERGGWIR